MAAWRTAFPTWSSSTKIIETIALDSRSSRFAWSPKVKSMADVDKQMQPLVDHVWGKPLPFPVMLDSSFETWERFGLPGSGTLILIDPEGRLVRGDEKVLAEKLKH